MSYVYKMVPSPVGDLKLVASGKGLAGVLWAEDDPERVRVAPMSEDVGHAVLCQAQRQLGEYFAATRTAFDLDLDFVGTEFQKRVWAAFLTIPFGEVRTYGEIARHVGSPGATRAVGSAANKNPIAIVAPCHRVIGASGKLTGFAGGIAAKVKLLGIEGRIYDAGATKDSIEKDADRRFRRKVAAASPTLFDWL